MSRYYSDEFKQKVLAARQDGMPFRNLRKTFKISDQTVRMWLREEQTLSQPDGKKCSCYKQRKSRFTDKERREIVHRYEKGESINALCEELQIGRSTLYRWIALHTEYRRYKGDTITSKEIFALLEENRMLNYFAVIHILYPRASTQKHRISGCAVPRRFQKSGAHGEKPCVNKNCNETLLSSNTLYTEYT